MQRLEEAWKWSDTLFDSELLEGCELEQPIDLRHPFLFYVGHLPAFAWNKACARLGLAPFNPKFDVLFERGIDPMVDDPSKCHDHPDVPDEWPTLDKVRAYRDSVRESFRKCGDSEICTELDDACGFENVLGMIEEHELMHVETLYYMLVQLHPDRKPCVSGAHLVKPSLVTTPTTKENDFAERDVNSMDSKSCVIYQEGRLARQELDRNEWCKIPAGTVTLGAEQSALRFGWDNEFGCSCVPVEAFEASKFPVTIGEFASFVAAGGYHNSSLWTERDWAWRCASNVCLPTSWRSNPPSGSQTSWDPSNAAQFPQDVATVLHRTTYLAHYARIKSLVDITELPVFCSLAEARAFASWKKCRIPTESEWHRMAFGHAESATERRFPWGDQDPVPGVHGNFGFAREGPAPVNAFPSGSSAFGVQGLYGDGWELTASEFLPLEGFCAMPEYANYSADFFDGEHFVLKGASWATHPTLIRRSFRNWYQDHYRYVFSKFRLVRDV